MRKQTRRSWLFCFSFVIMTIGSWKNFDGLLQWSDFIFKPRYRNKEVVTVFQIESNCGIRHVCPDDSFAMYLSTGRSSDKTPKLCIAGKYVIKPLLRERGRGLNAAIIDPTHFEVVSVRNFDTYMYNKSEEIAEWLSGVREEDILIFFTSDEASVKLSTHTKTLLNKLGSGKIQNLQFRSQWYMITQKGTKGYSTYEKITYSTTKVWGDSIEIRGCIPRTIPKRNISADEPLKENWKKVEFCQGKKAKRYKGFCNEPRFEMIMPALQTNKSLVGNPVYSLPIFVFASHNLELFISCLDNLFHQPGVMAPWVTVLYDKNDSELTSLVKIYGFRTNKTNLGNDFEERIEIARGLSKIVHPQKQNLIVIDSEVLPSPDFLFFFAQLFPVLKEEDPVSAISAWSPNCYNHDGGVHVAYRVRGVPKYAALIPIEGNLYGEMFVPDVSRVQGSQACHMPSLEPDNWIERPQDLLKYRYYHKMVILQQLSQVVEVDKLLSSCSPSEVKNETNVVYVKEKSGELGKILKCLGVVNNEFGEYGGIVRLFVNGKIVLLITSKLELLKSNMKTSTQIGLPHISARSVMYEKQPMPRIPYLRMSKGFKVATIYTPADGLKSTYRESFKLPTFEENMNLYINKLPKDNREYFRYGKQIRPMEFGESEYTAEYPLKEHAPYSRGVNVEKRTTFPMILLARDEREKLPMTDNFGKYLDIYVTTNKLAHRMFTPQEQRGIASKDIITSQETMNIPKGLGFGCKFPVFAGQDLDNRDRNMVNHVVSRVRVKPKYVHKKVPSVPNFGSESETQAAYKRPEGFAKSNLFNNFVEYPEVICPPSAKQSLCPPGMYRTELYAINKHTSPQVVV